MNKSILLLFGICLFACRSDSKDGMSGKWMIHQVIQNGKDVTAEHDPHKERYLIFNSDSTFKSGGRPFGENTGNYQFNKANSKLFLDSDAGAEDDSYWIVRINKDTMFWQGYGSEWAEDFQIIQLRAHQ